MCGMVDRKQQAFMLAVTVAFFLMPAALSARLVPGACIGGIGLWDSSAQVVREWGKPIRKTTNRPEVWWHYRNGSVLVTRWGYKPTPSKIIVLSITTRDRGERTGSGIGVGSTLNAVRAAFPSLSCDSSPAHSCQAGRYGYYTTFSIKQGRVTEVGVTLDSGYDDGPLQAPDPRCRKS